MKYQMTTCRAIAAAALTVSLGACKLDVTNPNAATQEGVLTSVAGIRALAIGMQGRLGNAMEENIYIPGLVSGEFGNTSATQSTQREFQNFPTASANSAIEETNVDLLDLWSKNYAVIKSANDIPGTRAGIVALAKLDKAMAYGFLIEAFQQIPLSQEPNAPFVDRPAVLTEILSLLASARTDATGTPLTAEFTGSILSPGFDLLNTIRAMQARYSLAAGAYEAALSFANEVPATATSVIAFSTTDINPFADLFHRSKFFGAISTFRTNAEAGDARVAQYTTATAFAALGGASTFETNIFPTDASPIPVFTQDELSLIRAEALARLNRLPEAIAQINIVRARGGLAPKTAADLPTLVAVLDQIFRERTYSLFATGLHWADERRLGKISLAKVVYLPYPLQVRATNTSTPANP
jgi:hypothetical protein